MQDSAQLSFSEVHEGERRQRTMVTQYNSSLVERLPSGNKRLTGKKNHQLSNVG